LTVRACSSEVPPGECNRHQRQPKETTMTKQAAQTLDQQMQQIALDHLFIETLETRNSDRMDFHEVSVWGVRSALMAAYEAGRQAAKQA
jgi:hypothetical protein